MKRLYTSYFNRKGRDPNAVVISCTFPNWLPSSEFLGTVREDLAPLWPMVEAANDGVITSEEYSALYIELLQERGLTAQTIVDSLEDGSILICYEKIGKPCHRRTLANWIYDEIGFEIPEWLTEEEQKEYETKRKKEQLVDSLVEF